MLNTVTSTQSSILVSLVGGMTFPICMLSPPCVQVSECVLMRLASVFYHIFRMTVANCMVQCSFLLGDAHLCLALLLLCPGKHRHRIRSARLHTDNEDV